MSSDDLKSEIERLRAENDRLKRASGAKVSETKKRSVVKALTYRVFIVCLDFLAIYLFTHKVEVALGFMIVSNVYTTVGYFAHERMWARIKWGAEAIRAS